MALKCFQPRRSTAVRSERPILRTTNEVETPNNCSLGLARYGVDMARSPCSWAQGEKRRALKARKSASCAKIEIGPSPPNRVRREGASPAQTDLDPYGQLRH